MTIKSVSDITLDHVWQALVWAEASQENPRGIHRLNGLDGKYSYVQSAWGRSNYKDGIDCCVYGAAFYLAGGRGNYAYQFGPFPLRRWGMQSAIHADLAWVMAFVNDSEALPAIRRILEKHKQKESK